MVAMENLAQVVFGRMARTKKPKVQIKRQNTSLGWAYCIYIGGMYMGEGLARESAREGAKRMLAISAKTGRRKPSGPLV